MDSVIENFFLCNQFPCESNPWDSPEYHNCRQTVNACMRELSGLLNGKELALLKK